MRRFARRAHPVLCKLEMSCMRKLFRQGSGHDKMQKMRHKASVINTRPREAGFSSKEIADPPADLLFQIIVIASQQKTEAVRASWSR